MRYFSHTWRWWAIYLVIFGTIEGGAVQDDVYTTSLYTPLNVSELNGILDSHDTNLQSAMDTIDDHTHLTKITANNIAILGTHGSFTGAVATLQSPRDVNYLQIHGAAHTPGFDAQVEWINVTYFRMVALLGVYVGQATHSVAIQLYNFVTSTWDTFDKLEVGIWSTTAREEMWENHDFIVPACAAYIGTAGDLGDVRLRFSHPAAGNANDHLYVDFAALYR